MVQVQLLALSVVLRSNRRSDHTDNTPARPPLSAAAHLHLRETTKLSLHGPDGAIVPAPISFVERSTTSSNQSINQPASSQTASSEPTPSPQSTRRDLSPALTDEQANFINSLYTNNVAAPAIVRVMERMLADRGSAQPDWERETIMFRAYTTTAPPAYEYED